MKYIFLSIFVLLLTSCGSNTYEDCVLDGIKNAKTQAAVIAIRLACASKYSAKTPDVPKPVFFTLRVNLWDTDNQKFKEISKIKVAPISLHAIEVTNYSDNTIDGVILGETTSDSCANNPTGYSSFAVCKGDVAPASTVQINCSPHVPGNKYCVVGFQYTEVQYTEVSK